MLEIFLKIIPVLCYTCRRGCKQMKHWNGINGYDKIIPVFHKDGLHHTKRSIV